MNVAVDITFQTAKSLSQEAGMDLWALGHHFNQVGPCTYRLQSRGEAASLEDASDGLTEAIQSVVTRHNPRWPNLVVTAVKTKEAW